MKKFLSILLVVAMGLGMVSCVNNTESDSVKAIREAKATQLLALAELHKAQAEAETLMANAQAALLAAQTKYQELENEKAQAALELEIQVIKAELEKELNRLLGEIAMYKGDLADELYSQISYWLTELALETQTLVDLEGDLALLNSWDAVDAEVVNTEYIEMNKRWIAYNEVLIAEYMKFIEANTIDRNAIYAQTIELKTEIDVLNVKADLLDEQIEDIGVSDIEDAVSSFNENMFDRLQYLEDEFSLGNFLDENNDEQYDADENLVDYIEPFPALSLDYPAVPIVRVNEENLAKLGLMSTYTISAIKDMFEEGIGEKDDKIDKTLSYADQTLYALVNYWAERKSTYDSQFKDKVIAATEAVIEAQEAWSLAAAEDKAAAEAVLVAALDALDKYTMIGANIDDPKNGTFTMFVWTTYNEASSPVVLFDPTTISIADNVTLSSGARTFYKYDSSFIESLDIYVTETNAYYIDELAYTEVMLQDIYNLDSDIVTLGDWANEFVNMCNAQIDEAEVLFQEYKAVMAELEAKEAELEAKMTALVTSEQLDNDAIASVLQEYVDELVALNNLYKAELEAYEGGATEMIVYESLLKRIARAKANIARINTIIDQIEADMNALLSGEEGEETQE